MFYDGKILIGKSGEEDIYIYPKMANRHGLIAGATGTGKTVTLKVMAESFSDIGVPVFLADLMNSDCENSARVHIRISIYILLGKVIRPQLACP